VEEQTLAAATLAEVVASMGMRAYAHFCDARLRDIV